MKRIEIVVNGQYEEEIALEVLRGVYGAVQNNGYTDVSVNTETVKEAKKELQIPSFLTQYAKGGCEVQYGKQRRG